MTDTAPAVWGRNRPLFEQQLATGHRFATQVAERFRDFGLTADVTEMALAETDAERANFHDEFDLTVEGRRIEVKSRSLVFTGPADFPYPTAFVYAVDGWQRKRSKPAAIVLVSQKAGGVAVVRVSDEPHWTRRDVFDRVRRHKYAAFEIERRRLADFAALVEWLRR